MKRLVPPISFLLCLSLMCLLRRLWPIRMLWPFPYNLLGVLLILVGLYLSLAGAITFHKAETNMRPFKEADKLVTVGPYRYSRNPMYLGLSLVLLGAWMLLGVLSSLLGVVVFIVTADRWYIRFEERMLQQKFGPAFDAYRSRTRRWM